MKSIVFFNSAIFPFFFLFGKQFLSSQFQAMEYMEKPSSHVHRLLLTYLLHGILNLDVFRTKQH